VGCQSKKFLNAVMSITHALVNQNLSLLEDLSEKTQFDLIREWADERGLYENGDTKTQALKTS
jgi:hypothetical protein